MTWNYNSQHLPPNAGNAGRSISVPNSGPQLPSSLSFGDPANFLTNHRLPGVMQSLPVKCGLTEDNCLTHLKLLYAIQGMKEDVGYSNGLWNIWDSRADEDQESLLQAGHLPPGTDLNQLSADDKKKIILSKIREKRWAIFVARAVDRYEIWWRTHPIDMLTEGETVSSGSRKFSAFPQVGQGMPWRETMLPPLGMLILLHSQ